MPPPAKKRKVEEQDVTSTTSVSKLKSQIRQAKRLLAHDDVKMELRQTTERRLEALETQLELASSNKKEQKLASMYHGVKFVERKKVLRKLNQVKNELEGCEDKAKRKALESSLRAYRIDLHYITAYPRDRKYIALFPDGEYITHDASAEQETDKERAAMRKDIKKRMKRGELNGEPELHLDEVKPAPKAQSTSKKPSSSSKKKRKAEEPAQEEEADDFFDV